MNPYPTTFRSLQDLADRIRAGEVVFFIGAGFSIDSEGNTAARLMTRLLIRLQGMVNTLTETLDKEWRRLQRELRRLRNENDDDGAAAAESRAKQCAARGEELGQLLENLQRTFNLRQDRAGKFPWSVSRRRDDQRDHDLALLAREYYAANDWFCAAFERMLEIAFEACGGETFNERKCRKLLDAIHCEEESIRTEDKHAALVPHPLTHIDQALLTWAMERDRPDSRDAGKALFLDTLGFADENVMGGDPWSSDPATRDESYRGKLLPRHHVLARLAREGLCPVVLTTNYDLLLEGAWREAGFESGVRETPAAGPGNDLPATPWYRMARVGSPVEFMEYGRAAGTSVVLKVHGCTQLYRKLREGFLDPAGRPDRDTERPWSALRAYLPSMVFTYREIQNWREDSWTQHYLATIQRTRTVAFVGYSLQDPVIHDAFRTVYEEMTRQRQSPAAARLGTAEPRKPTLARAFFFGQAGEHSFHGNEVLIAATHAVGAKPLKSHDHQNYIRFQFRKNQAPSLGAFPNLDDQFLWMYHLVCREVQQQCLKQELRTIATLLLNQAPRPGEVRELIDFFDDVVTHEREVATRWDGATPSLADRRQLERIAGWSYHFHAGLLREFACVDMIRRQDGPGWLLEQVRHRKWYYPLSANPSWTAWAVVVELALRRSLTWLAGEDDPNAAWKPRTHLFHPVNCTLPTILFHRDPNRQLEGPSLGALTLQTGSFDRVHRWPELNGAVGGRILWRMGTNRTPWHKFSGSTRKAVRAPRQPSARIELHAPSAADLWRAAHKVPKPGGKLVLGDFLVHEKKDRTKDPTDD